MHGIHTYDMFIVAFKFKLDVNRNVEIDGDEAMIKDEQTGKGRD